MNISMLEWKKLGERSYSERISPMLHLERTEKKKIENIYPLSRRNISNTTVRKKIDEKSILNLSNNLLSKLKRHSMC